MANTMISQVAEYRDLYNTAVKYNQTEFIFNGQQVLVSFAKYHLEFLEGKHEN